MPLPRPSLFLLPLLALATPCVHAAGKAAPATLRSDARVAVYLPPSELESRTYSARFNVWFEPGDALDDSLKAVGAQMLPNLVRMDLEQAGSFGLVLDLDPKWEFKDGRLQLTLQYNAFGPDGKKLMDGSTVSRVPIKGMNMTASAFSAARQALQWAMADMINKLQPDAVKFPPTGSTAGFDRELLVDRSKPVRTGTGFFINGGGQVLTAAHVQRECVVVEARKDGKAFPLRRRAASDLLDIAVLDSSQAFAAPLPFRVGEQVVLGESVTSVGYPLQGVLADSPNLTRGNVSSASGIKGSYGMFQFSAPIQPGNSGGPVVSDNGELLGVAVGTLNSKSLVDRGLIPQNVNFALDARHVARFLRRENVPFREIQPKGVGEMKVANDAALGATVQLACFE